MSKDVKQDVTEDEELTTRQLAKLKIKAELEQIELKNKILKEQLKKKRKAMGGRPIKYDPLIHPELIEALARKGTIKEDIAERMGITKSTLYLWFEKYPKLSDAYKKGYEGQKEAALSTYYKKMHGYEELEDKVFCDVKTGKTTVVPVIKKHAPDSTLLIFMMKNIYGWSDKQDLNIDGPININIDKDDSGLIS